MYLRNSFTCLRYSFVYLRKSFVSLRNQFMCLRKSFMCLRWKHIAFINRTIDIIKPKTPEAFTSGVYCIQNGCKLFLHNQEFTTSVHSMFFFRTSLFTIYFRLAFSVSFSSNSGFIDTFRDYILNT